MSDIDTLLSETRSFPRRVNSRTAGVNDRRIYTRAGGPTPRPMGPNRRNARGGTRSGRRSASGNHRTPKWFVGGTLNAIANCLDRISRARAGTRWPSCGRANPATIARSRTPELPPRRLSFRQRAQDAWGRRGDRVGIYLPLIPEVATPCSRARALAPFTRWCSCFSTGFTARPDERRQSEVVITPDGGSPGGGVAQAKHGSRARRRAECEARGGRARRADGPIADAKVDSAKARYGTRSHGGRVSGSASEVGR